MLVITPGASYLATDKYKDIDVMCNDEKLYKDHTLKFVYVTRWRTKDPPLKIQFFPRDKSQSSQDQDQEMTENNKAEIKSSAWSVSKWA